MFFFCSPFVRTPWNLVNWLILACRSWRYRLVAIHIFGANLMTMTIEIAERTDAMGVWTVEATGPDGEIYQATFAGPDAEARTREYAAWKYPAQ
jgi:hypothetical protein